MRKIIYILLMLGLCRCGVYKKYERPAINNLDSLYINTSSGDTNSLATLSWRELFQDPLLQQLIETGIHNNTDLQVARLKITEAEALLKSSKLAYLPSVSLNPQGTINATENQSPTKTYDLAVSADWEIDIFGKQTNIKRDKKAILQQYQAYQQAVQTQLIATIANSYYMLLMLDRQLEISRETAATWTENLRVMKALKKAGQANEMAVAQTEANKLSVEASILTLEQQIQEIELSITALLKESPHPIKRTSLQQQQFPDTLSTGIPLQLLNARPDIRQKEAELAAAFYVTNQARSTFYPAITLGGALGWTNTAGGAISNPGQWLFTAIGNLVQPIFNRGEISANLKVAKAQQEQALLAFQQCLLDAGVEVNNALIQWQTARKRITLNQKQIQSLQNALEDCELLMENSSLNYLEVLTARQTLLQAELAAVTDRFDEIQGVINLYHALGGGYE
ncbi:MAG: efflux transporter outer membrane subunit [Marinifilaceae bacterium]|nr:efflux transporter outer membrane subunit [Marinifilaceae bacterium]